MMLEMPGQKGSPILVANWKMNGDVQSIKRLLNDLKNDLVGKELSLRKSLFSSTRLFANGC